MQTYRYIYGDTCVYIFLENQPKREIFKLILSSIYLNIFSATRLSLFFSFLTGGSCPPTTGPKLFHFLLLSLHPLQNLRDTVELPGDCVR